ncbi:hypothetical protein QCA50_001851 [Cerrena zonata]|uniref:Chorein N-terminal domain-containing protein n=1 Tax=Cerrena zonata TaxID=2478898 RepID=A0AAW0GM54_9APHY
MWWLDPGKEVLNILFNRILAPYVENLDMNQVNYGIGQGQLTLHKLQLKKGALDKFRLPVDVVEGHLGKFTLSLHWMNLGNQPVEILIEDVYLLVVPSAEGTYDADEEEKRIQATKFERLENAELLHIQGKAEQAQGDQQQSQGLISSLIGKVINNLQVTVKNIHIRYEDKLSVPGHPFAAGVTLAGFTARSVDENWLPAFIGSTASVIHKLAKLESLAVYFDTDTTSLAGLSHAEFVKRFTELIAHGNQSPEHQFILQPVTGEGRIKMNNQVDKEIPRFDVQLLFDQIGVLLDDNQYRDVISLVDMYHFYIRQHQYQKYRPLQKELDENKPRALLRFATTAILEEVRDRKKKWTWTYFAERRDDRHRYVDLFKQKQMGPLTPPNTSTLEALEKKLSYEDIRFYRSIARSQLRKDMAWQRKQEEERQKKQQEQAKGSWSSWIWGSSSASSSSETSTTSLDTTFTGEMTEEQRKELYEVLDYDEKSALLAESFQAPRDALKARVVATLNRGSFALKTDPHGANKEIISIVSESLNSTFIQRPDNFEVTLSLGGFAIRDGTTTNTLYPLIVHVQESKSGVTTPIQDGKLISGSKDSEDPFFFLKFENNPLDERADSALTVKMRYMEIVYHRGYVEAIYKFFKPPASQLESVEALLDVASETLEGLRRETRAGLEYALQTHKTVDVQMDLNAPIIIIPEDITTNKCKHLVIDAGHISIESELANKAAIKEIQAKRKQQYTDEDYQQLESMMYDRLSVRLESAQFVIGNDLQSCLEALTSASHDNLHLLERINIDLQVQNSIVPTAYNLAKLKVSGHLPTLKVNLSDTKYKSLMRLIDVAIPKLDDDEAGQRPPPNPLAGPQPKSGFRLTSGLFGPTEQEYNVDDEGDKEDKPGIPVSTSMDDDEFFEAEAGDSNENPQLRQHTIELDFQVDILRASLSRSTSDGSEREVGSVSFEQFRLGFAMAKYVMNVDVSPGSSLHERRPVWEKASPTTYEGIDQSVDIKVSTVVVRAAPEPVISLYDFIMNTFVPNRSTPPPAIEAPPETTPTVDSPEPTPTVVQGAVEKIRVLVKLASVQVLLINDDIQIATLSLSTADVAILLRGSTLRVNARLSSLSLTDDSDVHTSLAEFKDILSIEGSNFADFQYQTFDPSDKETYKGYNSSVYLSTGSLKVHYLEQPLHDIYVFLLKLAEFKGLYDAATEAAVQRASEIERMQFNVVIKSPIIIFPSNPQESIDIFTMHLGEFNAHNSYDDVGGHIEAGVSGILLASTIYYNNTPSMLKLIDDININAKITQYAGIDRNKEFDRPDTQISVKISDVRLQLTQVSIVSSSNSLNPLPGCWMSPRISKAKYPNQPQ